VVEPEEREEEVEVVDAEKMSKKWWRTKEREI
jgi:hypothetical protein